ncbi:MAG TPA: hypothetical protein VF015_03460, partial [Acidimicrobiales bacterium]
ISYNGRTYAEGKKIGWRDGVQALWCILKYSGTGERVRRLAGGAPAAQPAAAPRSPAVSGDGDGGRLDGTPADNGVHPGDADRTPV